MRINLSLSEHRILLEVSSELGLSGNGAPGMSTGDDCDDDDDDDNDDEHRLRRSWRSVRLGSWLSVRRRRPRDQHGLTSGDNSDDSDDDDDDDNDGLTSEHREVTARPGKESAAGGPGHRRRGTGARPRSTPGKEIYKGESKAVMCSIFENMPWSTDSVAAVFIQ